VVEVLERGNYWIKGPEIERLESAVATLTDSEHAVALNSGTSALYATLNALGVDGREVIVPSFTYPATANAVVAAGGEPVFADIERDSYALSVDSVQDRITADTAGIVPVHFAGDVAAEIRALRRLADENGLFLLEDAAHSLGASAYGTPAGSFGDAATFSFAFNKIVTTGQGGMIVTDDASLADSVRTFRTQGRNGEGTYETWGLNLVMSSIHAAIGVAQMSKLDEFVERRRQMKRRYDAHLSDVPDVETPTTAPDRESVHFLYNVSFEDTDTRRSLQTYLADDGIPTKVYYRPVHLREYYRREFGYDEGALPVTERVSSSILTLPFHLNLSDDDLQHIGERVSAFFA